MELAARQPTAALAALAEALEQSAGENRPVEIFVLAATEDEVSDRVTDALGLGVSLVAATPAQKASIVTWMRRLGKKVCYVGDAVKNAAPMAAADIAVTSGITAESADADVHAVLLEDDVAALRGLREASEAFHRKQAFNHATPIAFDLVDISTTVFLHFGLFYSVLFNYGGLMIGTWNARRDVSKTDADRERAAAPLPRRLAPAPALAV